MDNVQKNAVTDLVGKPEGKRDHMEDLVGKIILKRIFGK
jgi:hypothetical protein